MNILVNLTTLTNSGIIPLWLIKFKELANLNNQIDIFFGNKIHSFDFNQDNIYQYNQSSEIKRLPYINHKLKFMIYSLVQNIKSIFSIFNYRHQYQVVYSPSSVLDLIITPFFLKIFNPKIIWSTVFDNIVPITDPGNKIVRFIAWIFFQLSLIIIKKADIIFVISSDLKNFLIKKGINKNKIVLTGNGIEIDLIKTAKKKSSLVYDGLFVGRINETKGIYHMLEILKIITQTYPKFILAIMGNGDDTTVNKFKNKIKEYYLQKNIKFLGYITGQKKFDIIKSSKTFWFLSVSKSESFGIALMEAVVSGIPAFVYNLPVFKQIYLHQEVNFSPLGDYQHVAKQILKTFSSKKFTNLNGKKLINKYSWQGIIKVENQSLIKLVSKR